MTHQVFMSCFAQEIKNFIAFKRLQGYDYTRTALRFQMLDRFLFEQQTKTACLTRELVEKYDLSLTSIGDATRYWYLSDLRVFARYIHQANPASILYEILPLKKPQPGKPYLYSDEDIRSLREVAMGLSGRNPLRPHVIANLIGLLAVTGMRIGEALALRLQDFDQEHGGLFIRNGKLGKDRWIPIADSTAQALRDYFGHRRRHSHGTNESVIFLNTRLKPLSHGSVLYTFHKLLDTCGIGRDWNGRPPCVHGLRHTFATNCLRKWYRSGVDVNARLPILATYLGHTNIYCTQVYLHTTAELMGLAAARFNNFIEQHIVDEGGHQ